jgi:hypothetical protein
MKGILFKPDMIQAIIEGRKTQTRRLSGLKQVNSNPNRWVKVTPKNCATVFLFTDIDRYGIWQKPRYQIGETVYIKEAIEKIGDYAIYKSDGAPVMFMQSLNRLAWEWMKPYLSPLHLPMRAARYFLVITDVRAERLQKINSYDIEREGLPYKITRGNEAKENYDSEIALEWFRTTWNSINKEKWESNPWVFVYTFRMTEIK